MLDLGECAERNRRLAIAGLTAALGFTSDPKGTPTPELDKTTEEILWQLRKYLVKLANDKQYWVNGKQPEIENFTAYEINGEGVLVTFTGKRAH